jgi:transposase
MKQIKSRKNYRREFKVDVIQQSFVRDNIGELAQELGIHPEMIYRWRREYEQGDQTSFPGQGVVRLSEEQKELERIKQENSDLRMERDILKKAIGIFTKKNG